MPESLSPTKTSQDVALNKPSANDVSYDNVAPFPDPALIQQPELLVGDSATEDYAASLLPPGVADLAGHGFADAPPEDTEAVAEGVSLGVVSETPLDINLDYDGKLDFNLDYDGKLDLDLSEPPTTHDIKLEGSSKVDFDPTEEGGIPVPNWELVPKTPMTERGASAPLLLAPLSATSPEATPAPATRAKEQIAPDILASYKERFGINPEDLEGMSGFDKLSRGQQKQALENLQQLTIGRIREEAVDGQAEDIAEQKKNVKFLGKVWISLKDSFTKKYHIIGREKQLAADIQKGGIGTHKAVLEQMVTGMKELGPEIKEGEDGLLEVQYIETAGLSPEVAKVAEVFNQQATKLSKIPHDWGMETATPAQQKSYKDAQDVYELQRGVLMKHMSDVGGDAMALKAIAKTESQMEMQRFIQTCPDAAEELKGINNQNALTTAMKSVGAERGYYAVGGAVARTALGAVAGFAAAPIIAVGIAGMRGWKRSGEALLAQDKAQQRGEVIITPKMQEARDRILHINDELAHVDNEEVKASLAAELGSLQTVAMGTVKNMIEAVRAEGNNESGYRGSSEKLNALIGKIKSAEEKGEDASKLQAELKRRIDYTNLKIAEGKMVFGDNNERLGNQYTLTKAMTTAEVMLAGESVVDEHGDKAVRRLAKLLDKSEEETNDARFRKKAKDTIFAGTIGGLAALAGAEFADAVKWMNGAGGTMTEKMFGSAAAVKEHITDVGASVVGAAKELVQNAEHGVEGAAQSLHAQLASSALIASAEYVDGSQALSGGASYVPDGETLQSATEASPDYTVVEGDNLSKIFAREIPDRMSPDVYRALKSMTPEELTKLGVTRGNIDLVHPGDKINVEVMKEYLAAHPTGVAHESVTTAAAPEATHAPATEAPYSNEGSGGGTGDGGESEGSEAEGHASDDTPSPQSDEPAEGDRVILVPNQMKQDIPTGPVLREAAFYPSANTESMRHSLDFNPDADFHIVPTSATMPVQTVSIEGALGKASDFDERTLHITPGKLTPAHLAGQDLINSPASHQEAISVHDAAAHTVAEVTPANIKPEVMRNLDEYTLKKMNETRKLLGAVADQPATEIVPRVREGPSYDRFKLWEKNGIVPKQGETLIEYEGRGFKDDMLRNITVGAEAERAAIEKTARIAGGWADVAANGPSHNSHWGEVRGQSLQSAANAPLGVKDSSSLEAAAAEMHALLGKAQAMGFHASEKETTAGAFLDRVAKELREPLTSEGAMARSREIYKVIYNQVPTHGQLRLVSAEAIVKRNLLPGVADTPEGKEFLAWKRVLLETQKNTGVSPAPNENLQSYVERATRVALHKDPTLHASTLIGRKIDEAALVTPKSAPVMPVRPPIEEVAPPATPVIEKQHILEQPVVAPRTVPKEALTLSRESATEIRRAPYPGMEEAARKLGVKPEDMDKMMETRVPKVDGTGGAVESATHGLRKISI